MKGKNLFIITFICAFLLGEGAMYYLLKNNEKPVTVNTQASYTTGVIKCSDDIKIDETGIAPAVGKIYDATVTIQNYQGSRLVGSGSGFIYKKEDKYAYIMTNHHVIEKATKVIITLSSDDQIEGEVLGSDEYLDLAIVRIKGDSVKQVATIGNSEKSSVGDTVVTVGSPVGYEYRGTVTRGTLSGKNRLVEVSVNTTNDFIMQVLQIDAAINPGNSGGPLVNINGEVIGINSLKLIKNEIEGMGFAIPIEYAMQYTNDLEQGKKIERPFIGITMLNTTDTYRLYQNGIILDDSVKDGVVIVNVSKNSGAEKAELKRGDVILEINGNKVSNSAYLKYELFKCKAGETINIKYQREDKIENVDLTLTKIED